MKVAGSVSGSAGVASGHRLATEAGIKALKAGGTAVDAALAAAFTQWAVNAPQSGPGGEMVALVASPGSGNGSRNRADNADDTNSTGRGNRMDNPGSRNRADDTDGANSADRGNRMDNPGSRNRADNADGTNSTDRGVHVYGGWSRVPLAAGRDGAASGANDGETQAGWPATSGPRNAVVPGSLRGAEAAWRAHGRLDWANLFAGALTAAAGHTVTARMAEVYERVQSRGHTDALRRMLGRKSAPRAGATICMPDLATTLELIAWQGPDAFYRGSLADRLVAAAEEEGAALRHEDLDTIVATVEPAVRFDLGDIVVWVPGAPSQAPITPALLASVGPAIDPTSRHFAETVAPIVEHELTEFCARGPARPSGTAVSTAVDSTGMSATVVHSLAGVQFGTGWVAGNTGVAFSNRVGTALSERSDLPGCNPRPGAMLPHTLSAAHVKRRAQAAVDGKAAARRAPRATEGEDWMTVATPGGDRQVQWLAQAIQRFRRGAATADIAAGPRWFVCPTGDRFGVPAGIGEPWYAFAEPGIAWRDDARLAGYEVRTTPNVGGGLQVVVSGNHTGPDRRSVAELASDPRSAGAALAVG